MLDGAGSGVACTQRDELSRDAEQRYHGKQCVCGCDSSFLKLDSFSPHKRTGQWVVSFFNMQRGTGNYLVFWAVYIDSCSAAFSGEILHMPAPYTVTLKEKVFLFYLFARS